METHPKLLTSASEIQELAKKLETQDVIAFDTEFIRETTFYPIVEIIQVATREESWLVDAQAFKKGFPPGPQGSFNPALQPLLEIFENPKIMKIVHAAQGDQECLYTSFGVVAKPSLDTAVAASLCGYGEGVGLGNLLKAVLNVSIKKGHARTNWSVRPLPPQLAEYAHADVQYLVELGLKLLGMLDQLGRRRWALELSSKWENKALYEPDVDGIVQKLARGGRLDRRGYAALKELVRWREERVRQLNVPRRWVADDAVLVDLAHVRPKDMAHLSAFRGLNKGELKNSGEAILSAFRRAQDHEDEALPPIPRPQIPSAEEARVMDLLQCYIGILADEHEVSPRLLVTAQQLLPILRRPPSRREEFVRDGLLSEEAALLVGDELIAFLSGKVALSVQGAKVHIVKGTEN